MSWKNVQRWQWCLAANEPAFETLFRTFGYYYEWLKDLATSDPGIPTRPNSLDWWIGYIASTFIHIWIIFVINNMKNKYQSNLLLTISNLSPKKGLRHIQTKWPTGRRWRLKWEPQQESKQHGKTVDSWQTASSNQSLYSRTGEKDYGQSYQDFRHYVNGDDAQTDTSPKPFGDLFLCISCEPACSWGFSGCGLQA